MQAASFPPASAVEGIKSVPFVCVCPSVSQHSHGWTVWLTDAKFGGWIDLDKIPFEGQGYRSKVKVGILQNVIFGPFYGVTGVDQLV